MDNVYTTLSGKGQNPPEVFFYFPVSNPLYANLVTISESKMLWTLKFNPRPNKTENISKCSLITVMATNYEVMLGF